MLLNKQTYKQANKQKYDEAFKDLPMDTPFVSIPTDKHSWHLYVIKLQLENLSIDRDQFIEMMGEGGVGTSVHFIPLHLHPYWSHKYKTCPSDYPNSLEVFKRVVSLPIYPSMTDGDVDKAISLVRKILLKFQKK